MSREWKPGDVAMVTADPSFGLKRTAVAWLDTDLIWHFADGCGVHSSRTDLVAEARPLVVIDPEDREHVERLHSLYEAPDKGVSADDMQAALREFANPVVKPEEPTGLGAVVEDADGANFTRVGVDCWVRRRGGLLGFGYAEIDVVRVLSEGVTT